LNPTYYIVHIIHVIRNAIYFQVRNLLRNVILETLQRKHVTNGI